MSLQSLALIENWPVPTAAAGSYEPTGPYWAPTARPATASRWPR